MIKTLCVEVSMGESANTESIGTASLDAQATQEDASNVELGTESKA
jgi:hypothetical protein